MCRIIRVSSNRKGFFRARGMGGGGCRECKIFFKNFFKYVVATGGDFLAEMFAGME